MKAKRKKRIHLTQQQSSSIDRLIDKTGLRKDFALIAQPHPYYNKIDIIVLTPKQYTKLDKVFKDMGLLTNQ